MAVSFDHSLLPTSRKGPRAALQVMFPDALPASLLDLGCGNGAWVRAALEFGISDVLGVDGGNVKRGQLLIPPASFRSQLLSEPFFLDRKFDVALCLEVGEHLDEAGAQTLIANLVRHADLIYFSAACPGQPGQFHLNCQWPGYWQELFNQAGYACDDAIRWSLWNVPALEFYYRQNMFLARRDHARAGHEPRIQPVIHPEMMGFLEALCTEDKRSRWLRQVEEGSQTVSWYLSVPAKAFGHKLNRKFWAR
ncbi:MAG TPA: class I SAM-dependent methyltransferase [Pyrinomonadaceae bacterium]|nr:class I SAM-dependent methyltransferase [Pyrinomonadaceae bacterium]